MRKFLFYLVYLFLALHCQNLEAQVLSKKIATIAKAIAKEDVYHGSAVGFAGEETKQWKRFEKLARHASDDELKQLTDHKHPVVRCYAFQALANRKKPETFPILVAHLNDDDSVSTFIGCIMGRQLVGDFFLNAVDPRFIPETTYELDETERQIIDSLILFETEAKLLARSWLLEDLKPQPAYYPRLQEIYSKEADPFAFIALARYRREGDQVLVKNWLAEDNTRKQKIGLKAVLAWPDTSFYPLVEKIHQQELQKPTGFDYALIKHLYLAVVQYKDEKSKDLLLHTLQNAKGAALEYHKEYIWLALMKYPDAAYQGILETIEISAWKKEMFQDELSRDRN